MQNPPSGPAGPAPDHGEARGPFVRVWQRLHGWLRAVPFLDPNPWKNTVLLQVTDAPGADGWMLPSGNHVEPQASDTGNGMADAVRQQIFEPFFTTKAEVGKAGSGLGGRFKSPLPEDGLSRSATDSGPVRRIGKGEVLIVEDEALLREAATSALESLGYTVHSAENGLAGVEAFRLHHNHLFAVLLDLKMPLMGGREAFEAMRGLDPDVPVLVCTGSGENEEVQALRSAGAVGMLSKPYRIRDLEEALRRLSPP